MEKQYGQGRKNWICNGAVIGLFQQNPDLLYKTDCNITVKNDIIRVSFINDECKLTAQYNQNFELLSTQKEENGNYMAWWFVLPLSIVLGFVAFVMGSAILTILIVALKDLWENRPIKSK